MQTLTYKKHWLILSFVTILLTFYLSLRQTAGAAAPFLHFDKVCHFSIYCFLAYYHRNLFPKIKNYWIFLFFCSMGVAIEFLQKMTGYRFFERGDILANSLGILFGQFGLYKFYPDVLLKLDRHFS